MELSETNWYFLFWGGAALCLLIFYIRQKRRIRTFLLGGISGLGTLTALHFFGGCIGFTPTLCLTNLLIAGFLGIPGVVLLFLSAFLT